LKREKVSKLCLQHQKNVLALGGLFGNVATDEVHPQPHISMFDKKKM